MNLLILSQNHYTEAMSRKFFAKIEEYAFLRFCQGHSNRLQASEYSRKMSNFASGFRSCFHSKNISSKSKQLLICLFENFSPLFSNESKQIIRLLEVFQTNVYAAL